MRFRAPVPAHAPAVLAVLEARDRADLGEVEYTLGDLIDEWTISDLDLDQGARVVEVAGGQMVAYAASPAGLVRGRRPRSRRAGDRVAPARVDGAARP